MTGKEAGMVVGNAGKAIFARIRYQPVSNKDLKC